MEETCLQAHGVCARAPSKPLRHSRVHFDQVCHGQVAVDVHPLKKLQGGERETVNEGHAHIHVGAVGIGALPLEAAGHGQHSG